MPSVISTSDRAGFLQTIAQLPATLRQACSGLTDSQLETPYRPEGWTVRQVIHHVADSHMNAYVRYRLALTEDTPLIKPYNEAKWAELPDAKNEPIDVSLHLLDSLHQRWHVLLQSLDDTQFARTYRHPELGEMRLDTVLSLYAWHSRHHAAHITELRKRSGW